MTIFVTDKVGFVPRPSEADVLKWRSSTNHIYEVDELYENYFSFDVMKEIIENSTESDVFSLTKNPDLPTFLLEKIVSYNFLSNTSILFNQIVSHDNCSPQIITNIFEAIDFDEISVLSRISLRGITPLPILLQLLPTKEGRITRGVDKIRVFEVQACSNPTVPVIDALVASQWIDDTGLRDNIWRACFDELRTFLLQKGIPVDDYPKEWVQELVWSGGLK